jgi:hypothetical protein
MNSRRGPWFLLTGLVFGLLLGLLVSWVLSPVEYTDLLPSALLPADQERYRAVIALAFQADGNLERARQRLALLGPGGTTQALAAQAQQLAGVEAALPEARALAFLVTALNKKSVQATAPGPILAPSATAGAAGTGAVPATLNPSLAVRSPTPLPSATASSTPALALTPLPTFTLGAAARPTFTPGAPFSVKEQKEICDITQTAPMLQVEVVDAAGRGVPGVRIVVSWASGEDVFFTGLMPQFGSGYADFTMAAQVVYSVRAGEGGVPVNDVRAGLCKKPDGSTYTGGWKIRFGQ